jgi:RNA polymerase sigma-70 factor (ECF subfamily)
MGGSGDNDRERFEALAMPLARPLYGFALRLTRRSDDASDLVQETFLRAYQIRILYSIHVNEAKRRGRRPATTSIDSANDDGPMEIADWSGTAKILTNPAIDWEGSEVEREVSALPEEFHQAVLLVDLGDLTYEEAAKVAGCPVGTIRSRLARARRRLAERLRDVARSRGLVKE